MQKLMPNCITNERGSILVVALAFAVIMAIAGGGLLMLSGNSISSESTELLEYKALMAAESGLKAGLRWLETPANWDAYDINRQVAPNQRDIATDTINGIRTTVIAFDSLGSTWIESDATPSDIPFVKRVSCIVSPELATEKNYFNSLGTSALQNLNLDGPLHTNQPIRIGTERNVLFSNGRVTAFGPTGTGGGYGTGAWGNDYNNGINLDDLTGNGTQGTVLDQFFTNKYNYATEQVQVSQLTGSTVSLPPQNVNDTTLLYFSRYGQAYFYRAINPTSYTLLYTVPDVDNQVIRIHNTVKVLGRVRGNVTVATDPGFDICPVGNLVYVDFAEDAADNYDNYDNVNNYGIGNSHSNSLALVSGRNIHFSEEYKATFRRSTGILSHSANSEELMFLTASLIATEPGCGITWEADGGFHQCEYNYQLRAIGNRAENTFFNYAEAEGQLSNSKFRFYYDSRLQKGLSSPRVPSMRRITAAGNNLYLLRTTNWRERNIPIPRS